MEDVFNNQIIKMPYNYDPFGMYFVKLKSYSQKR